MNSTSSERPAVKVQNRLLTVALQGLSFDQIRDLRNAIHTWIFSNAPLIEETYQKIVVHNIERDDEITAPLMTFARLANDNDLGEQLEVAIAKLGPRTDFDAEKAFRDAIRTIVGQGFKALSAHHVINEMNRLLGPGWSQGNSELQKLWHQPKFVTDRLLADNWVDRNAFRPRINHEINARIHAYALRPERIKGVADELSKSGQNLATEERPACAFCMGCSQCAYRDCCSVLLWKNRERPRRDETNH